MIGRRCRRRLPATSARRSLGSDVAQGATDSPGVVALHVRPDVT